MPRKRIPTRSLSARLISAFVAVILVTTMAVGVPAYLFFRAELERQAWARVAGGERVTRSLLEAEKARLVDLAILAAQRPTLRALVQEGDATALTNYLQTFQAGVDLDILLLHDATGRILVDIVGIFPLFEFSSSEEAVFYVLPGSESQLALLASRLISGDLPGEVYVTVGVILDDGFARELAVETGFDQSILIDGKRVATSLAGSPATVNRETIERVAASGQAETAPLVLSDAYYYTALFPMSDDYGEVVALVEVALSIDELVATNQRMLLTLIFGTLLVAVLVSGLAGLYARKLTAPVIQLTKAALNISQGDLITPIPIPGEPDEIATLAAAFEKSRVKTRRLLDDLSQAKVWSETLIRSVAEGIVTIDDRGTVTSFSQGAERITGWMSEEVVGLSVNRVFPLADGKGDFLACILPSGAMPPINVLTRARQEITLAMTCARLDPPDGEATQTVLVFRDITEKEAARRLRSYFLANISHEFRTPLSALKASVEWLLEEIEELSMAEIVELLNSVHFSVTGLQTLIDNLLESANIEVGHFRIRRRPTDMGDVVTEAIRVMKPLLERRQHDLSINIPAQLPLVNVDPTRLTQVLVNLLSNASKYSPMEKSIELSLKIEDGALMYVEVSDRGPGISSKERSDLFRRFVRLGEKDKAQYGVGLGLSVVKTIVEEHGGEVGVKERPGGGSIFWFVIPLDEVKRESPGRG